MGLLDKLFGTKKEVKPETENLDKRGFKVYPCIKSAQWPHLAMFYNVPLGGDLVLVFAQDINDRFHYLTKEEAEQREFQELLSCWRKNIQELSFDLFSPQSWNNRVFFNQPGDFSNEKIFNPNFIKKACELLNTDKVVISISRRHRMQITSFYAEFLLMEDFLFSHFSIWRNSDLDDEVITEMVLIAEKDRITHIVPLGFRMNLYEKDGQRLLNYSAMDKIGDKIDFQEIMEKNKIEINSEIFSL